MTNQDGCIFCKIILDEQKAYKVFENKKFVAFLDKRPLFKGHCLLLPKEHTETLADLPQSLIGPLFELTQLLTKAIEKSMQAQGSFVAINNRISQSVPHLHIHIVPRNPQDGLKGFFWPRTTYDSESEMQDVQKKIASEITLLLTSPTEHSQKMM